LPPAAGAPLDTVEWPALRDRLLVRLLDLYLETRDAWHAILSERLWRRGERVDVVLPGGERVTGELAGIADDGRLIVAGETVHRLAAGEVSLYRKDRHG
jgi:biotin-(acetyl-CoA carboxylase) ligase